VASVPAPAGRKGFRNRDGPVSTIQVMSNNTAAMSVLESSLDEIRALNEAISSLTDLLNRAVARAAAASSVMNEPPRPDESPPLPTTRPRLVGTPFPPHFEGFGGMSASEEADIDEDLREAVLGFEES